MKAFIGAWLGTKHDAFIGWVLRLNHNAVDATASGKIPVEVELLYNGNPITAGKCEYLCKSVADSGMGNGYCGFSIPVPQNYAGQEKAYTLRIRGTQFVLSREAQAFGLFENKLPLPQLEGHMDDIHNGMVRGWAWNPAQPDEAVMVDLLIDGVAVQRIACNDFRADLKTHGKGDGRHAFHALLPLSIHDGGPHDVHVRFTNTRIALAGSPRSVRLMPGMPAHMVSQADFLLQDYRRQLDDISRMLSSAQTVPQAELQKQSMQLDAYKNWVHRHDTLSADDRLAITARVMNMQNPVTFSIIMPVYNPEPNQLRLAIDSVQRQLYPYWELCIADDASTDPEIARILKKAAKDDARIKVKTRSENGHIALASNDALTLATGGYAAFLDHDDMLAEHALYVMADAITRTHAELLYSDEDKIDMHGVRYEPYFKPDWNYDLMLTQNFACHFLVMKRDLLQSLGGLRSGFDGSQDHDLVLRASEKIPALSIHHVPFVLYHWRAGEHSTARTTQAKPYTLEAARKAVSEHLKRVKSSAKVEKLTHGHRVRWPLPKAKPLVSIIIPTRDNAEMLARCVASIHARTDYKRYEIVIVDNDSVEQKTHDLFTEFKRHKHVRVLRYPGAFNYSAINNYAVKHARGSLLCLMNNDMEALSPGWLGEMVAQASRPGIGAVGAKLLYPDDTVQHAGVTLGLGGVAGHPHKHVHKNEPGYFSHLHHVRRVCAVTAACVLVSKRVYKQARGLDETHLPVAFNDVDLCLAIGALGLGVVWTPYAELKHYESASRGAEDTPAKKLRAHGEILWMQEKWRTLLQAGDPYYNPNLCLHSENFALADAPRVHKPWHAQAARELPKTASVAKKRQRTRTKA